MADVDDDPWHWTIEQVVECFTSPTGLLRTTSSTYPDPNILRAILKENDIEGEVLLTAVDLKALKKDLKIKSLGHRYSLFKTIEELRRRSKEYQAWKTRQDQGGSHSPAKKEQSLDGNDTNNDSVPREIPIPTLMSTSNEASSHTVETTDLSHSHTGPSIALSTAPLNDDIPINVRSGETVGLDVSGKKKRRLVLLPAEPQSSTNTSTISMPRDSRHQAPIRSSIFDHDVVAEDDDKPLTVDKVFYGNTALGKEVNANVLLDPVELQALQSTDEPQRIRPITNDGDNVLGSCEMFVIAGSHTRKFPHGQIMFVNNCMKRYLCHSDGISQFIRTTDGSRGYGFEPYSDRQTATNPHSLTIFTRSGDVIVATKESQAEWREVDDANANNELQESNVVPQLQTPDGRPFVVPSELQYLTKYISTSVDQLLPSYGYSDDEDFDPETIAEMEAEAAEDPVARTYTREQVNRFIDESIADFEESWATTRLPRVNLSAWRLWKATRRADIRRVAMDKRFKDIKRMDRRIQEVREGICLTDWSSEREIRDQCQSIELSVFDRLTHQREIVILKQNNPPAKPDSRMKKLAVKAKRAPRNTGLDEEEIGSGDESSIEELRDFIVEDSAPMGSPAQQEIEDVEENEVEAMENYASDAFIDLDAMDLPDDEERLSDSVDSLPANVKDEPIISVLPDDEEFIDLTMLSSSEDDDLPPSARPAGTLRHETSSIMEAAPAVSNEAENVETPAILKDPFAAFRQRRTAEKLAELASEDSPNQHSDVSDIEKSLPSEENIQAIINLKRSKAKMFEVFGDNRRLLIWAIGNASPGRRRDTYNVQQALDVMTGRTEVNKALRALKKHERQMKNMDAEESEGRMQLAVFYIIWTSSTIPDGKISVELIVQALKTSPSEFQNFWPFVQNQLQWHQEHDQVAGSPDEDSAPKMQKGKRKNKVQESQEGVDLRHDAKERAKERKLRSEQLQMTLKEMGVSGTPETAIINPAKGADEDYIILNPHIGSRIQGHQLEGVRFMWTEVVKAKGGCLLAHDMGLGKTMQCITLLVTIAEASKSGKETITKQIPDQLRESRTLVLCPPTLVENWCDELLTWVPRPYSDSVGEIRQVTAKLKPVERFSEIEEWADEGGVLVMSYDLFRGIVLPKKNLNAAEVDDSSKEEERLSQIRDILLKRPAIVITDEAQSFKSKTSKLHAALTKCETHSRIALTGSPISNNLLEYYMIVNFISPHYLGSESEFTQKYIEPIKEGLYQDASIPVQRNGAKMLEVLKTELNPIMHRIDWVSIQNQTRGKTEMIIRVCPTELQKICYNKYVDWILRGSDGPSGEPAKLWAWLSVLRLLLNHPRCFRDRLQAKVSNSGQEPNGPQDLSPEDKVMQDAERILQQPLTEVAGFSQPMITELLALTNAQGDEIDAIELSNKMIIVMGIINHTLRAGEKVLVFSHSIPTLDFVGDLLTKEGKRFDRLDGKLKMNLRQNLTKDFNTDNKTSILLISTRAGGTGLNLYGASRVIIIDDMFNPTWEKQAIGRAFRIGQQRHVYVYRLLVSGSFEEKLQNQALFKLQLATRVIDKKDTIRHALRGTANEYIFRLKDPDIENMESFKGDKLVLDKIIEVQKGNICSVKLTDSFMEEEREKFSDEEQRQVDEMIRLERLRRSDPAAYAAQAESAHKHKSLSDVPPRTQLQETVYPRPQDGANPSPINTTELLRTSSKSLYARFQHSAGHISNQPQRLDDQVQQSREPNGTLQGRQDRPDPLDPLPAIRGSLQPVLGQGVRIASASSSGSSDASEVGDVPGAERKQATWALTRHISDMTERLKRDGTMFKYATHEAELTLARQMEEDFYDKRKSLSHYRQITSQENFQSLSGLNLKTELDATEAKLAATRSKPRVPKNDLIVISSESEQDRPAPSALSSRRKRRLSPGNMTSNDGAESDISLNASQKNSTKRSKTQSVRQKSTQQTGGKKGDDCVIM